MPEFFINPTKDVVIRVEGNTDVERGKYNWIETRIRVINEDKSLALNVTVHRIDDEFFANIRAGYRCINADSFRRFLYTDCVDLVKKLDL